MSRRKTERLLGLVVCLLSSPRYLTAVQIRAAVPGYPESFEAFKRMFERDKEELRELGIPLETGFNSPGDDEAGYRIPRQAYVLPEIRLEPDEAAVLSLAARVWRQAELAGAAAGALLKLRAAGVDASGEETAQPGIEPRLLAGEAAFGPLWEAVRDRRPVTFAYRAAGPERTPAAPPAAVGGGEPARPLVRGRARHRPGRGARVPAEPHRGRGAVHRPGRIGDRAGGYRCPGDRARVGYPAAGPAAGCGPAGTPGGRVRDPPLRHSCPDPRAPDSTGQCARAARVAGKRSASRSRTSAGSPSTSRRSAPMWSRSSPPTSGRPSSPS